MFLWLWGGEKGRFGLGWLFGLLLLLVKHYCATCGEGLGKLGADVVGEVYLDDVVSEVAGYVNKEGSERQIC